MRLTMRINLIAGPNNELLMTHEDDKRPFPIVIGTFAGNKEVVPIAQELMSLYNGNQLKLETQSLNVLPFTKKDPPPTSPSSGASDGS